MNFRFDQVDLESTASPCSLSLGWETECDGTVPRELRVDKVDAEVKRIYR